MGQRGLVAPGGTGTPPQSMQHLAVRVLVHTEPTCDHAARRPLGWSLLCALATVALTLSLPRAGVADAPGGRAAFTERNFGRFPKVLSQSLTTMNEQLTGKDPRYEPLRFYAPDSRLRKASRPVGLLDILYAKASGTCTASLIAEDLLLTNAHCADDGIKAYKFFPDYFDEGDGKLTGYDVEVAPVEIDRSLDYAILRVKGSPGRTHGSLTLTTVNPIPGDDLSIFHHPLGQPKSVTRYGCRAKQVRSDGELLHLCDTMPGSSGSPVLTGDSRAMLALHHAGTQGSSSPVNLAITVATLARKSSIIARLAKAVPPVALTPRVSPSAGMDRRFTIRNKCDQPVRVAVRLHKGQASGTWTTLPWQQLAPGAATSPMTTSNRFVYYVAETLDSMNSWDASVTDAEQSIQRIDGLWYRMNMAELGKAKETGLTCDNRDKSSRLVIRNRCNRRFHVAVRVVGSDGKWATHGFYELDVGERISWPSARGEGYVYAEVAPGAGEKLYVRGGPKAINQVVGNRTVSMSHSSWDTASHVTTLGCSEEK